MAAPPGQPLPSTPVLDSVIISDFPEIFAEFRGKRFSLLWRGGRDGFAARDFHSCCDSHTNTLTVILDRKRNIFGGFTPVEWESRTVEQYGNENNCLKADSSLKSFLLTPTNRHNVPGRRFALKAEAKDRATGCDLRCGPNFCDIGVSSKYNANTHSYTHTFGNCYANNTGLDEKTLFTGSWDFQVNEIEVFEITD
jgi:hypothetical protein